MLNPCISISAANFPNSFIYTLYMELICKIQCIHMNMYVALLAFFVMKFFDMCVDQFYVGDSHTVHTYLSHVPSDIHDGLLLDSKPSFVCRDHLCLSYIAQMIDVKIILDVMQERIMRFNLDMALSAQDNLASCRPEYVNGQLQGYITVCQQNMNICFWSLRKM